MSYQEKRTIVNGVVGILVLAAYCIFVYGQYQSGVATMEDLKFWANTMLVFIGIMIALSIIIMIVFHILISVSIAVKKKIANQSCEDKEIDQSITAEFVEDEMDKLIELKSTRVSTFFLGVGFVAGLISLTLSFSPVILLNALFFSFFLGGLFGNVAQLYYYRKGIYHG